MIAAALLAPVVMEYRAPHWAPRVPRLDWIRAAPSVSIEDLRREPARWNGRLVRVRGWLGSCWRFGCAIGSADPRQPRRVQPRWGISIAGNGAFDQEASAFEGWQVTVAGRFSDECRTGNVICVDRAPDLTPVAFAVNGAPLHLLDQDVEP